MSITAYIGLGANLGDARASLKEALAQLGAAPGIVSCQASGFYRSAPVEAVGPDFINAVARLHTTLAPLALLDLLQEIEQRHGRARPYRNAPRTLDLDLLLYGDEIMEGRRLTLPHPRMHERAFVLAPLTELAPSLTLNGRPIAALLQDCRDQSIERLACRPDFPAQR